MKHLIYLALLISLSCETPKEIGSPLSANLHEIQTPHFTVEQYEYYQILEVKTPFVGADFSERYLFYPKDSLQPEVENISHYIPTPVSRLIVSSTTHVGFLDGLDEINSIVASSNVDLVYNKSFQERYEDGEIFPISSHALNGEELLLKEADAMLAFAIDMASYKEIVHLRDLGHTVLLIPEFMEQKPLDKAKWLFPISLLFEKEVFADAFLQQLEKNYMQLKNKAALASSLPSVFMGFPWKGTWYMSGGLSFQANFIHDAGGNYRWKEAEQESGMPLNIEQVFAKALDADIWINPGDKKSLAEMLKEDERFAEFAAFKNKQVFNNNFRLNDHEGNDYWESGVLRPDLILADLIAIFHPNILPEHLFFYYQALEE